ncbi:MAG: trehalose-6-phosphate synthase [Candidatus Levybacteria bacterium]|nr:trehalose-6-phosphate synthase [Candidatus Levybacteria bacterium]
MKQIIAIVLLIAAIVGLVAFSFTIKQVDQEEKRLSVDLQHRSTLLAESLRETVEPNFINKSDEYLQTVVEKFANRERLAGLAIYDNKGKVIAVSSNLPKDNSDSQKIVADAMDGDNANGDFVKLEENKMYVFAVPLHDKTSVVGSLIVVQNARYIDTRLQEIWKNNLLRLFLQILLLSIAAILFLRWIIFRPMHNLVESLKLSRSGNKSPNIPNSPFFQPLVKEITNMNRSLIQAQLAASEEARLSLEKIDSPWTAERLKQFVKDILKGRTIIVVSNREPYIHTKNGNKIDYFFPASGMVTAIEPVMQATGGTWIAHGSGDADKLVVDENNSIQVPPDDPKYTLKRVWLTEEEEKGYYYGFSNEALYPLCLNAHTRPIFSQEDYDEYKKVNAKFAKTVLSEIKNLKKPIVCIQDFHFALLPRMIKNARPDATIGLFWHVPWVSPESFSICPWKKELLDGMLGADLIGFHTQLHCNNFIETVGRELESLIDFEQFTVTRGEHISLIKPFPISIAFSNHEEKPDDEQLEIEKKKLLKNLGIEVKYIGIGVDRLDYTKGILERIKAIELFLKKYTEYRGEFTFIQIAPPSKSKIKKYQEFAQAVEKEVERVNLLYKIKNWKPIVLIKKLHTHKELNQYYKLANVCLVTSLHDGMNLVAKEFAAARSDEKGVLILSQFTGASKEFKDALIVNPYSGEQTSEAIYTALIMPLSEQTKRMKKLRNSVKNHNIYRWSAEFLKTMVSLG